MKYRCSNQIGRNHRLSHIFKFNGRDYGMISDHGKREAYRMLEELDGEIVP